MLMADPHIQRSYLALLCKSQFASLLFFTFLLSFFVYSVSLLHQGYEFKPHECLSKSKLLVIHDSFLVLSSYSIEHVEEM